jgi:hypothetical protein
MHFDSFLALRPNWVFLMFSNIPGFLATPYDDCTFSQSRSRELVVFSPSVGEYVIIAWYVFSFESPIICKGSFDGRPTYHGRRILPHRIKDWLRNRGLHWSCFCSLTLGGSISTRIVESMSGSIFVFCNSPLSVCGFRSGFYILIICCTEYYFYI